MNNLGYSVSHSAFSGEDALGKVGETRPDLVLMDIKLKGRMDGVEAGTKICEMFDIPVIYMTGYIDQEMLKRANTLGSYGYILKPFDSKDLVAAIERTLCRHEMSKELDELEVEWWHEKRRSSSG